MGPGAVTAKFTASTDWTTFDRSLVQGLLNRGAITVSVAVADHGTIVHTAAGGPIDRDTGVPATPAALFRVASNSKVLTGTVIMELVEQGKLQLDEDVLPLVAKKLGVRLADARMTSVTLKQLLSHTSGFAVFRPQFFDAAASSCPDAARQGLTRALQHDPGAAYQYSNMNFCVLGQLIELITGTPYEQAIRDRLLTPLGITDMRVAATYDTQQGDVRHPTRPGRNYMEALGPAGAWIGTASDLVNIIDSLDDSLPGFHPLQPATVKLMQTALPIAYFNPGNAYGLALRLWSDGTWGHTGTVESAHSMVIHRPDGITWAVVINGEVPSDTDKIRTSVDAAFATLHVPSPIADPTIYTVPVPTIPPGIPTTTADDG